MCVCVCVVCVCSVYVCGVCVCVVCVYGVCVCVCVVCVCVCVFILEGPKAFFKFLCQKCLQWRLQWYDIICRDLDSLMFALLLLPAVISHSINNLLEQNSFQIINLLAVLLQSSEYRKLDDARCLCWPLQQFGVDQTAVGPTDGGPRSHLPHRPSEELRWNKASPYD